MEDILLCEACITAIESFLATAFSNKIWPKTEKLKVRIKIEDKLGEPDLVFEPTSMTLRLGWPKQLSLLDAQVVPSFGRYLLEFCVHALGAVAALPEAEISLERMITQENLLERTVSFSFAHFSQSRVLGRHISSLSDLSHLVVKSYPPLEPIPTVVPVDLGGRKPASVNESTEDDSKSHRFSPPKRHSDISVSSVINTHLWDKAGWNGVLYAHLGPAATEPPLLGLAFKSKGVALSIFEEWNDKFGRHDVDDRIRVSIIRGINSDNVHHYRVHITQSIDTENRALDAPKTMVSVSRLNTMVPDSSINLEGFLEQFERLGVFFLVPSVISVSGGEPELLLNQSILSRNLHVRQAWEIGENDQDTVAIKDDDNVIYPKGKK